MRCTTNGAGSCDLCATKFGFKSSTDKSCIPCGSNCKSCTTNGGGKCDDL